MSLKIILAIAVLSFAFVKRVECREEGKVTVADSRATTTSDNAKAGHVQRGAEEVPAAAASATSSTAPPVSGSTVTKQESAEAAATHSSIKRSLAENLARQADPGCCG